jgi:hypothetical protein
MMVWGRKFNRFAYVETQAGDVSGYSNEYYLYTDGQIF